MARDKSWIIKNNVQPNINIETLRQNRLYYTNVAAGNYNSN